MMNTHVYKKTLTIFPDPNLVPLRTCMSTNMILSDLIFVHVSTILIYRSSSTIFLLKIFLSSFFILFLTF